MDKNKTSNDRHDIEKLESDIKRVENKLDELIKYIIQQKWLYYDNVAAREDIIECGICVYKAKASRFSQITSRCRFNGGSLVRYICPKCGVIFGPMKMINMTQDELDQEYRIHYSAYSEGDSTENEIKAFYSLIL